MSNNESKIKCFGDAVFYLKKSPMMSMKMVAMGTLACLGDSIFAVAMVRSSSFGGSCQGGRLAVAGWSMLKESCPVWVSHFILCTVIGVLS